MIPVRVDWRIAAVAAALALVAGTVATAAVSAQPVVQFLSPVDGAKVYPDRLLTVEFRVADEEGASPLASWSLEIVDGSDVHREIQRGVDPVEVAVVHIGVADAAWEVGSVTLRLSAVDVLGRESRTEIPLRRSSPKYRLIPMRPGNHSVLFSEVLSTNASGRRISLGPEWLPDAIPTEAFYLDRRSGLVSAFSARSFSNIRTQLSPDGSRFFYKGSFRQETGIIDLGFGFTDLQTDVPQLVAAGGEVYFSVSRDGRYAVYQKRLRGPDGGSTAQYFWQDTETGEERQLTDSPDAVVITGNRSVCPRIGGTTPHISGDGQRVVIVTGSTLDMTADDPAVGCRVFLYDVPSDSWELAAELGAEGSLNNAALSENGRWLSFTNSRPVAGGRQAFPALLDLETGTLTDPVAGISDFASFDSVITYDGRYIVLSSFADLDPRVGNVDHNLELFVYDRETGAIDQVSETTGGVGLSSNNCEATKPRPNADAEVIVFGFAVLSVERCVLEGAQRNEVDGFEFRSVRAVRKREGNRGPEWRPPVRAYVRAGELLEVDFTATDPDGDILTFFAQERPGSDVPPGSEMRDWRDGSATFSWPTRPEDTGRYTLRVAVFDEGGGEDWIDLPIAVCSRTREDGGLLGILGALFTDPFAPPPVPVECRGADANGDGSITAADLLAQAGWE